MEEHSGPGVIGDSDQDTPAEKPPTHIIGVESIPPGEAVGSPHAGGTIRPESIPSGETNGLLHRIVASAIGGFKSSLEQSAVILLIIRDALLQRDVSDMDPSFPEQYAAAYWKLRDIHGALPGQADIAAELGYSRATVWRRRRSSKIPKVPPRPES